MCSYQIHVEGSMPKRNQNNLLILKVSLRSNESFNMTSKVSVERTTLLSIIAHLERHSCTEAKSPSPAADSNSAVAFAWVTNESIRVGNIMLAYKMQKISETMICLRWDSLLNPPQLLLQPLRTPKHVPRMKSNALQFALTLRVSSPSQ